MTDSTKWVWVSDKTKLFVKAQIVSENGNSFDVRVTDTGEIRTVNASQLEKVNPVQFSRVGDMAELTYLNEPSVVDNLSTRWKEGDIYTYSGLFLVAVNPYKSLSIYDDNAIAQFKGKRRDEGIPHIYAVAEQSFRSMLETGRDQSILITGESGAGKTENTKKAIQYLSSVTKSGSTDNIDARILQTNPILEAFGNAQTIRNSNSSRFGKFIKIQFGRESNSITGASIQWYLLEKSRVVTQHPNERNYHVFYQLLKGASPELKNKLELPGNASPKDFTYLASGAPTIEGIDDGTQFTKLVEAFRIMGFQTNAVDEIMKIIAAVLMLGEIKYKATSADQGSIVDISNVERVARLLGVNADTFLKSILQPRVKIGREYTTQSRNASQAQHTTNAVAKALYERLFGYIIEQLNLRLGKENAAACCIGVLDIAGFEIFEQNSFEQLCINYTNEKLQQFFNHHMFVLEQEEYVRENVDWDYVDYGSDLQPTIDLIEQAKNPMGIFSCLNEESVLPSGSDLSFNDKLIKQWEGKNPKFNPTRLGQGFKISHYAQVVEYQTDGWIEKNKDPLSDAVEVVLSGSSNKLVESLFAPNESLKSKGKTNNLFRTVAQRHKEQLTNLMEHLEATHPHFVRCIIPNTQRSASIFDNRLVLDQLRCNGVLEGIRIARSGFPNRLEFVDFCKRYKALAGTIHGPLDSQQACATILQRIKLDSSEYKVGISKVFFRNGVLAQLEHRLDALVAEQSLTLQALARGAILRMNVKRELHRRRAIKTIAGCFKIHERFAHDPWWQFNAGLKPLLMSKESMDNSKKDLRMQRLESSLHRLKEEQVSLLSSKNELRSELIASLRAKEELSKSLDSAIKDQKERDENYELALNSALARDEASRAALHELTERHSSLRTEFENHQKLMAELESKYEAGLLEKLKDAEATLIEEKRLRIAAESERDTFKASAIELSEKHENSINQLKAQLDKASNDLNLMTSKYDQSELDLKSVKVQNEQLLNNADQLSKTRESKITELETALSQKDALLKSSRLENEENMAKLKSETESFKSKYAYLSEVHQLKLKDMDKANNAALNTQKKLDETTSEVSKLREWLSKAKSEIKTAVETRKELNELQDAYKVLLEEKSGNNVQTEKALREAKSKIADLENQISKSITASQLEDVTHQNNKLRNDLDVATDNLLKLNDELSEVKLRLDQSHSQQKEIESKLKLSNASLDQMKLSCNELEKKLGSAEKELKRTNEEYKLLQSELEKVQSENKSQFSHISVLTKQKQDSDTELATSMTKISDLTKLVESCRVAGHAEKLAATQKELEDTQILLRKAQTQTPKQTTISTSPFKARFGDADTAQELADVKQDLARSNAEIKKLQTELESARSEHAQAMVLRQKCEKLQREKAMLVQDRSHLMLGVQTNKGQIQELEVAKARASEVKRLQSEINVLKLKLVRSERDKKHIEGKGQDILSQDTTDRQSDNVVKSLTHRLRLAEIAKLQLAKTVSELSRKRSPGIAVDSPEMPSSDYNEALDSRDLPISVRKHEIPYALRNISNDRRVSEHTHLAAEQVKNTDLETALDIYKQRANDFHAKLEKAELVVESAVRGEKAAAEQVEEYKRRLERIDDDHSAEMSELRRELMKSQRDIDNRDAQIAELAIKAKFSSGLQEQMKSMTTTLKELSSERDRLAKDKAKLEKRLHDMVSTIDHQPRQLQEQIVAMKHNEQHMMREQGELRWKLERKARLVDQLRRSLSDSDSRIEQCRAEIDRLQANEAARDVALRRANREVTENAEKYLMAQRELEQYKSSRKATTARVDTRPAFI